MKKLMFAAALAATGMTFAATPAAQVYDVQLSIKTTAAAKATINSKTNPLIEEEGLTVYRKQASVTWKGLIWGCDCEAIDGVWEEVNEVLDSGYSTIKGCILWDVKTKQPVYIGNGSDFSDLESAQDAGFGWDFLNAIDKTGKKVEGVWTMEQDGLACEESFTLFKFKGAGFGNLKLNEDCASYVTSISGNFAGYMKAPTAEIDDNWSGCVFCGYTKEKGSCEFAEAWEYCDCDEYLDEEHTAAYGTWKVSYNSGLSIKLSKPVKVTDKGLQNFTVSIRDVYNFKSLPLVETTIAAIENTFWQIDPTGCDELGHALALAKENTYAKEQALDAVSYENLKKAVATAEKNVVTASNNVEKAVVAYDVTNAIYIASKDDYRDQMAHTTNSYWCVCYVNGGDVKKEADKGTPAANLAAFDKFLDEVKLFKITYIQYADTYPADYAAAKKFVADQNKKTDELKATMEANEANSDTAGQNVADARKAYVKAQDALTAAQNDLANINLLQYKAQTELDKAMALEAAAQKAYDENGCED